MKTKKISSMEKGSNPGRKREVDRRKEPSKGYTYITTVGWICRREKVRRKDDRFMF